MWRQKNRLEIGRTHKETPLWIAEHFRVLDLWKACLACSFRFFLLLLLIFYRYTSIFQMDSSQFFLIYPYYFRLGSLRSFSRLLPGLLPEFPTQDAQSFSSLFMFHIIQPDRSFQNENQALQHPNINCVIALHLALMVKFSSLMWGISPFLICLLITLHFTDDVQS